MQNTAPSNPSLFPSFRRLFRWAFSWRMIRRALIVVVAALTLLALTYAIIDWRGLRTWQAYKNQLTARGVQLDFEAFVPPTVPDDQNFTMTPFLAPLFDYNPLPLQPGQNSRRDTNRFERVIRFADNAGSGGDERSGAIGGAHEDFGQWLAMLKGEKEPAASTIATRDQKAVASELLKALDQFKPVLTELRQASRRPYARFNVRYDEDDPWAILLPHLQVVRRISALLLMRASAELTLGDTAAAFDDLNFMFFLAHSIEHEPFVVSHLVRLGLLNNARIVVWQGLASHQWSDAQLQAIQDQLQPLALVRDLKRPLAAERAASDLTFGLFRDRGDRSRFFSDLTGASGFDTFLFGLAPRGWLYFEQISYHQLLDEYVLPGFDGENGRVHPSIIEAKQRELEGLLKARFSCVWNHRVMSRMLLPSLSKCFQRTALAQTGVSEALIACALERHRLANGRYPDNLQALIPAFLLSLPRDVFTGEPLKYRLENDGRFLLYSIGWNEKDDGGAVIAGASDQHLAEGDWVWVNR
jgi:hypothetical protein